MNEFFDKYKIVPKNIKLYETAFFHSSYAHEHEDVKSYERLEFLGDAVLQLAMSDYIYRNFEEAEGEMTKIRSNYVCENALYRYMHALDLVKEIKVGKGALGEIQKAIIADIFEALMGAIYIDQGFQEAKRVILEIVTPYIIDNKITFFNDYKSILQEAMQTDKKSFSYELISESGPDHDKTFTIAVVIDNVVYGKGSAGSKKEACQLAAKDALEKLARN